MPFTWSAFLAALLSRTPRRPRPWGVLAVAVLLAGHAAASDVVRPSNTVVSPTRETGQVNVGYFAEMFSHVDERDARVAIQLWSKEAVSEMGVSSSPMPMFLHSLDEVVRAVRRRDADILILPVLTYAGIKDRLDLVPLLIGGKQADPLSQLVLIVQRDGNVRSLSDLLGKRLSMDKGYSVAPLARIWLEGELLSRGHRRVDDFFAEIVAGQKMSQAVLSVFFEQTEACVVSAEGFQTMVELNPQLGRMLQVLARSPRHPWAVLFVRRDMNPEARDAIVKDALAMHTYERGRQVLTLFQVERVHRGSPAHFEAFESMVARSSRLVAQATLGLEEGQ